MTETTAVAFNPYDRSWWSDPYPLYRQLRDGPAVGPAFVPGLWYSPRYRECDAVLRNPGWGNDHRHSKLYKMLVQSPGFDLPESFDRMRSFIFLDPPDHTRLRSLVSRAFTPRVVEQSRDRIARLIDELLAPFGPGDNFDVVAELAYPLPVAVICELLGVPLADRFRFRAWSQQLASSLDPELVVPVDVMRARMQAIDEFGQYFTGLVAERRRHPTDDLLSNLVELSEPPGDDDAAVRTGVEQAGDTSGPTRLSHAELLATLTLLLVAGYETTVNLVGNAVLALGRHPDQRRAVIADRSLIRPAVEEVLRWDPPVQLASRTALSNQEIDGVEIPEGDLILLLLASANRDDDHVADGDRFDVARPDTRHLSFSAGAHHCLGAPLARAEAQMALGALIERFGDFELGGEPRYRDTLVLRGIDSLVLSTH